MSREYGLWRSPHGLTVLFRRKAMEGVLGEVAAGFHAIPKRGAEVGGLLLGTRDGDEFTVIDFEPVPIEHRFGPSYHLSDADIAALEETLQWSHGQRGLSVLGWFRSDTRPDFTPDGEDRKLLERYFERALFLLLQPHRLDPTEGKLMVWDGRELRQAIGATQFPLPLVQAPEPVVVHARQVVAHAPEAAHRPAAIARESPPAPPEPVRAPEPKPRAAPLHFPVAEPAPAVSRGPRRALLWTAVAIIMAGIGGVLGYFSLPSESPNPAPAPVAHTTIPEPEPLPEAPAVSAAPNDKPEDVPETIPETKPADVSAVRPLLDRWADTLLHGDTEGHTSCYAARVAPYFRMPSATRRDVRLNVQRAQQRYGPMEWLRISDVNIAPDGPGQAVATFRKQWRTLGPHTVEGDHRERLTLRSIQGHWQIASEQEIDLQRARHARR